jgi:hypothetical protein
MRNDDFIAEINHGSVARMLGSYVIAKMEMELEPGAQDALIIFGFLCFTLIAALVVAVFYLLTLQKALSRVARRNRLMEPGLVWLSLIPLIGLVWSFFIATRVPDSLRNEFRERGNDDLSDYGKRIGLANAILGVVVSAAYLLWSVASSLWWAFIVIPLVLVSLVLFIIFWVRIAGYSRELATPRDYGDDSETGGPID